ncbi:MAG: hypothetical protein ACRDWD_08875 [Acidimicrobiia bacterium]
MSDRDWKPLLDDLEARRSAVIDPRDLRDALLDGLRQAGARRAKSPLPRAHYGIRP